MRERKKFYALLVRKVSYTKKLKREVNMEKLLLAMLILGIFVSSIEAETNYERALQKLEENKRTIEKKSIEAENLKLQKKLEEELAENNKILERLKKEVNNYRQKASPLFFEQDAEDSRAKRKAGLQIFELMLKRKEAENEEIIKKLAKIKSSK